VFDWIAVLATKAAIPKPKLKPPKKPKPPKKGQGRHT
jgi:hypothetical protein